MPPLTIVLIGVYVSTWAASCRVATGTTTSPCGVSTIVASGVSTGASVGESI